MSGKQPYKLLIEYCPDVLWDDIKLIFRFYFSKVVRFSPELMKMLPSQLKEEYGEGFKKSCVIEGMGSSSLGPILHEYKSLLFIRDPIERVLVQFKRRRVDGKKSRKEFQSISAYVDFLQEKGLDNLQTRLLSNNDTDLIISCTNEHDRKFESADKLFDEAVRNFAKFDWIFFANDFDVALINLYKHFGWRRKPYYQSQPWQFDKIVEGISDPEIEMIMKMEKYDFDICRYVSGRHSVSPRSQAFRGEFNTFYLENSDRRLKTKFEYFLFDLKERFFGA